MGTSSASHLFRQVLPFIIAVTHRGRRARWQGATIENIGQYLRSDAASGDASAAECHRNYESQHRIAVHFADARVHLDDARIHLR